MKALFDTNVVLDVWLLRDPFWRDSASAIGKVEIAEIEGFICPTTITTLHYLGKKQLGEKLAREHLFNLLKIFRLGQLKDSTFHLALESQISDFEDAVIEAVAIESGLDAIITRNTRDFKKSRIRAIEPLELVR